MSEKEDFGLKNWKDLQFTNNKRPNNSNRNDYLRLTQGSNVIRVVTNPYMYYYHKYKENKNDHGFGDKIKCSRFHGSCLLCEKGLSRLERAYVGVIERDTGSYKVLDMSKSVLQDLQKLSEDDEWGTPTRYDIDIVVDKDAGPQGYYTVIPKPPKPMSPEDQQTREEKVDLNDLKLKCSPFKPETVIKRVNDINQKNAERRGSVQEAPASEGSDYDFTAVE